MTIMSDNRVVVLIDMDCFYCQVEVRLNKALQGKPLAVVQYNTWRGGGIIAVNYEARDKGVKRGMRGDEAKKLCPSIVLCKVAEVRGKADLSKYRNAGREVVEVLQEFSSCVQVASIDESYLDITEAVEERLNQISEEDGGICLDKLSSTFVLGYSDDKSQDEENRISGLEAWFQNFSNPCNLRLAVGAMVSEEIRAAVFKKTGFRCSAGISYNKPLAKLVCTVHKPNRQTVLPPDKVELFYSTLPVRKMRNLGGKFGREVVDRLGCETMSDLAKVSLQDLQQHYDDKNGLWLYNIARGIDREPVTSRLIAKSIGCSKNFPGRTALATKKIVEHWMRELITELVVRLTEDQAKNKRFAQHLTVSVSQDTDDGSLGAVTRSGPLPCYNVDRIVALALQLISKTNVASSSSETWNPPIKFLSLSAGKFNADCTSQKTSIQSFFKQVSKEHSQSENFSKDIGHVHGNSSISTQRKNQNISTEDEEILAMHKRSNKSSLDYFFKPGHVSSDNELTVDMFGDEISHGSYNDEFPGKFSERNEAASNAERKFNISRSHVPAQSSASKDGSSNKSEGNKGLTQSRKRKSQSPCPDQREYSVCPDNLESAVCHSFFARYLLSQKERKVVSRSLVHPHPQPSTSKNHSTDSSHTSIESKASTSRDSSVSSHVHRETEVNSSDQENSIEDSDVIFERCEECGKLISLQEFLEHVDYHSALRLQKELNETLTPPDVNTSGPSTLDVTKQQTSHHSNDSSSRDSEAPPVNAASYSGPPLERCSYCSKLIPLQDFPEHIDYHSALNLQRELNKPVPLPVVSSNVSSKAKKARSSKQAPSPPKKGKCSTIASFFGPK